MKNANRKMTMVLHIICPIAAGALIYGMLSPDVFFIKKAVEFTGGTVHMPVLRTGGVFSGMVRNYLPDMMWGYSLVFALFCIIGNHGAGVRKVFLIAFLFSAAMEMVQKASFVPGTFDVFDIFAELLTETLAAWIIYKLYSREDI
ncbi:MAG: hypothetical protein K1W28_16145 [Lachnospiraceae bacterium]